jgi:hypothetical protein
MVKADDAKVTIEKQKVTAMPMASHEHMADCLASVLAKALGQRGYQNVMVKGYPGFVDAMEQQKVVTVEGTSTTSQEKRQPKSGAQDLLAQQTNDEFAKKWAQGAIHGREYWGQGDVGMVRNIPTKLVNDYWFDSKGDLKRPHISLAKPSFSDSASVRAGQAIKYIKGLW